MPAFDVCILNRPEPFSLSPTQHLTASQGHSLQRAFLCCPRLGYPIGLKIALVDQWSDGEGIWYGSEML